ncbi:uncharacterized protein PHACADRAFT_203017 [Phanerochaete carnosa HHB-10118-sp]|uniref:Uncharacterized protein n=1 Tax=Phanerochaete carnosa (strain HHB-10118-sp) TaxID=650164 RepID=K5VNK6_PHACS|nr:uncharacterized protein PHACADRAFT_203017 [Phanerochaete carnosa HHB-10118-sp]EKM48275.1 hypothetical protein PHACADRAFT_203017 [Phanerochaete carnosa HHB-10118-sp]
MFDKQVVLDFLWRIVPTVHILHSFHISALFLYLWVFSDAFKSIPSVTPSYV